MILKHRDRELLRFEWTGARGVRVLSVNEAERKFLPIDMFGTATDESLWKWISARTVPRGRKYILSEDRLSAIEEFIQKRVANILEYGKAADDLLKLNRTTVGITPKSPSEVNDEKSAEIAKDKNKRNSSVGIKSTNFDSLGYQILENMKADKYITAAEIADILQVEQRTVERKIRQLRENGEIVRVGSRKAGHWLVNELVKDKG